MLVFFLFSRLRTVSGGEVFVSVWALTNINFGVGTKHVPKCHFSFDFETVDFTFHC
jgi:hypothetical protein